MKDLGSFEFIKFLDKEEHQKRINNFFIKNSSKITMLGFFSIGSTVGERSMKIIGGNEKDYNFYGEDDFSDKKIKELYKKIKENKIDNFKIPLLSYKGSTKLINLLKRVMKDFIFHVNLSSVSPIIDKRKFSKKKDSYMRYINKFEKEGFLFGEIKNFEEKIKKLHEKRWGHNREKGFFNYLKYMNEENLSKSFGLYKDKELVAYIQLIITGDTLHYYYSIFNEEFDGSGSVIINYAIKYFLESSNFRYFSFGRGSEEYKHRWNTGLVKNYEVRAFLK